MNILAGIGLSFFLILARALFFDWPTTTLALSFDIVGLALLLKVKPHEAASALAPLSPGMQLLLIGCLPAIGWALYLHLQRPSMDRSILQREMSVARLYRADSSCDPDVLRKLARQTPTLDSSERAAPGPAQPLCTAQWMQVHGGPGQCLVLMDGRQNRRSFCTFGREFYWVQQWSIRSGDLIPTQIALGRPSAFLRPSGDVVDWLLYPRGQIIETRDNPDHFFREHLWRSFWVVFVYLFLGVLVLAKLLR